MTSNIKQNWATFHDNVLLIKGTRSILFAYQSVSVRPPETALGCEEILV